MRYRVGADVGGTFTDLVATDEAGRVIVAKALTTPADQSDGVLAAIAKADIDLIDIDFFSHGTTVGVNAVIENKGAKVAIIITEGFRDALELRRGQRVIDNPDDMYNLQMDLPQDYVGGYDPLVRRPLRFEVPERLDYRGRVLKELDEPVVRQIAEELRKQDIEAAVICYLFSFMDPAHERHTAEIVREVLPELPLSLSSDILPVIREYERLSTATVNAYVMPIMRSYLQRLRERLRTAGFQNELFLMQSNGGIMSASAASMRPVYTIDSGPAGGVSAAAQLGVSLGYPDVISFDMGGTTAKICVIREGNPEVTSRFWLGGRYFIGVPVMDMVEIGAGGGSIASVDAVGAVHVGPRSAGSVPGPACYSRGGTEPTVTDADLVLGYINADYYLGGDMTVDAEASRAAIKAKIADRLGMEVPEAAHGIYRLVNANMIAATRVVTVQRGHDPRDFTLLVSGGTAAIHAVRMAQELRVPRVVVPLYAGVFSAVGLITADSRYDAHRSYVVRLSQAEPTRLEEIFKEIAQEAVTGVVESGFSPDRVRLRYEMDMRYLGQAHEVSIEVPARLVERMDRTTLGKLGELFHQRHLHLFGHDSPGSEVELMTLSVSAVGPRERRQMPAIAAGGADPVEARKGRRQVYFEEAAGYVDCDTYERSRLAAGNVVCGPAVIEQMDTTTVIPPGEAATVDPFGTLIVELAP